MIRKWKYCLQTLALAFCSAMMVVMFMYAVANAEDILLDISAPVKEDKNVIVATYYRNEPQYYFFTVVYKFEPNFVNFQTKLSFNLKDAAINQYTLETWIAKSYERKLIYVGDTRIEICPINPELLLKKVPE